MASLLRTLLVLAWAHAFTELHIRNVTLRHGTSRQLSSHTTHACDRAANAKRFYEIALGARSATTSPTDKVTQHAYETMYGLFLMPLRHARDVRMLEIGLGCNMGYGPGASVSVWQRLLPDAELWEAEFDAECVEAARAKGQLEGVRTLTGDQGDAATLEGWKRALGGELDVIVDDGGHKNSQLGASFDALWPLVKLGGVYVLEDLQFGHQPRYTTRTAAAR